MNYAHAAQTLASQGRYGDSMLVHMTPKEVGGLQALARSQGTSLTINPQTGMPEAFNLSRLLPMAVGAGLAAFTGMNPLTIGLLTGGIGTLATGSLEKGLMIGLGAGGGAGLAGSLANLASPAVVPEVVAPAATSPIIGAPAVGLPSGATTTFGAPLGSAGNVGMSGFGNVVAPGGAVGGAGAGVGSVGAGGFGGLSAGPVATLPSTSIPVTPSTIAEGASKAFGSADAAGEFLGSNKMNLAMSAAPSLIPPEMDQSGLPEKKQYIRPYELDIENASGDYGYTPGSTEEQEMLRYKYRPLPVYEAAQGGLVAFADGGQATTTSSAPEATAAPEEFMLPPVYMSQPAVDVYRSIARTQTMAGLPALDINRMRVGTPAQVRTSDFITPIPVSGAGPITNPVMPVSPTTPTTPTNPNNPIIPNFPGVMDPTKPKEPKPDRTPRTPKSREVIEAPETEKDRANRFLRNTSNLGALFPGLRFGMNAGGIASYREGKEVRKQIDRMAMDPYDFADFRKGRAMYSTAQQFAEGGVPQVPRFLSGGGDGMSDSIPAVIADKQPARLADGEFVIPADVVSHLGNGSSKAGAKQLYAMMDRIREKRTGKKKQAPEVNVKKYMPA